MKRINPLSELKDENVFNYIELLKKSFKIPSNNVISKVYSRTDAIATTELYTFADCINKIETVDKKWLARHIEKIEANKNPNNIFGSLWEIIFAGILIGSNIPIILHPDSNPGIDISAQIQNITVNFSLKRYDKSAYYKNLELMYNKILTTIKNYKKSNLKVIIFLKKYPEDQSISAICKKIVSFNFKENRYSEDNERFLLIISTNIDTDRHLSKQFHSYQLTLISELHKNEKKNLYDKIDDAIENLQKFKKDGLNVLVMHINQNMPIDSIEKYTKEYFENKSAQDIDAIVFYQPCIISDMHNTQLCHVLKFILNESKFSGKDILQTENVFADWKPQKINFPVGVISSASCQNLLIIDNKKLNINERYMIQNGEIYQEIVANNEGILEGDLSKLSMGIRLHSVIQIDNQLLSVKGNFPLKDELELI